LRFVKGPTVTEKVKKNWPKKHKTFFDITYIYWNPHRLAAHVASRILEIKVQKNIQKPL
jgi:hypothetical protein